MCSASMGAEGSVTLQLREAVEAPDSSGQSDTTALTIGYPETDLLADIQGSIQATGNLLTKIYHATIIANTSTPCRCWHAKLSSILKAHQTGEEKKKIIAVIYSFSTHNSLSRVWGCVKSNVLSVCAAAKLLPIPFHGVCVQNASMH